ncbi:MAG TPA: hypothetical protein VGB59_03440 [Allosphingosinicella sp.]
MLQPSPLPATSLSERLRTGAGRRTLALALVILIEGILLLMLLSFGAEERFGDRKKSPTILDLTADQPPEAAPEESSSESEQPAERLPAPEQPAEESPPREAAEPRPVQPTEPLPLQAPLPPPRIPIPASEPAPANVAPRPTPPPTGAPKRVYGPPDKGRPAYLRDTERVGTAPNGEPLYAAAWYEEPRREALGAYLSTAQGPGWGLIACRTAPQYRVEDCVGIAEYPEGSKIMRSVLAAAWEFKVRPPRRGGQSMVGSWVRIRIDYGIDRR